MDSSILLKTNKSCFLKWRKVFSGQFQNRLKEKRARLTKIGEPYKMI